MDTNLLAELARVLSAPRPSDAATTMLVAGIISTAITSLAGMVIAYLSKGEINKIHTAVNSERTAMLKQVDDLKGEILTLVRENTKLTKAAEPPPVALSEHRLIELLEARDKAKKS